MIEKLSNQEIEIQFGKLIQWELVEDAPKKLQKLYTFNDFLSALAFTQVIGELAEQQQHHPSILLEWGRVNVTWWTHDVKGLSTLDFKMAELTDDLYKKE